MDFSEYLNVGRTVTDSPAHTSDDKKKSRLNDRLDREGSSYYEMDLDEDNSPNYGIDQYNGKLMTSKISGYGSELLAGFSNAGLPLQNMTHQEQFLLGNEKENVEHDASSRNLYPTILVESSQEEKVCNIEQSMAHRQLQDADHQLRVPCKDPIFLFTDTYSKSSSRDDVSNGPYSPGMYSRDRLSPEPSYLGVDSDMDELLSVHSDLSEVSKEYEYVTDIHELDELIQNTNSIRHDLDLGGETNVILESFGNTEVDMTPPRINVETFEVETPRNNNEVITPLSVLQPTHNSPSTNSPVPSSEKEHQFQPSTLSPQKKGQSVLSHDRSNILTDTKSLLSVEHLPSSSSETFGSENAFDEMLQGRRNRQHSASRSRSTSRRRVVSRSLSADERARSLSTDREHLLELGGRPVHFDDSTLEQQKQLQQQEEEESPLNLSGKTRKKMTQKHPAIYACELCDKKFTRPYNLKSHLRTHTDERPFICKVCGKAFARQHDKKRHEDLHTGKKRYICGGLLKDGTKWGCGKKFARSDALGRHFKTELGKKCITPLYDEASKEKAETVHFANE